MKTLINEQYIRTSIVTTRDHIEHKNHIDVWTFIYNDGQIEEVITKSQTSSVRFTLMSK